jgi:F-box protein 9
MQTEDNEELARFREEWRAEVRARTNNLEKPKITQPETPLELYSRAVIAEEQGQLDEALTLYRQAFRREPNVDKLFHREESAKAKATTPSFAVQHKRASPPVSPTVESVTHRLQEINLRSPKGRSPELEAVLKAFPDELMFITQDELTLSPLESLPLEVIVEILMQLAYRNDTNAIERFASICRKARAVSLDPHIWRYVH